MSPMNVACHLWMSHITHEWVMSHMNKSCHTLVSRVTQEWVTTVCSALQYIAVCCSAVSCSVFVCCSLLQGVAVCWRDESRHTWVSRVTRVLQCVAVCCSVLQCVAVCCSVLQCESRLSHFLQTPFLAIDMLLRSISKECVLYQWPCNNNMLLHSIAETHDVMWRFDFLCRFVTPYEY